MEIDRETQREKLYHILHLVAADPGGVQRERDREWKKEREGEGDG